MPNDLPIERPSTRTRHYLAPWYVAYLILGVINSGMLPFLLPLALLATGHDLDSVAYVVGAYSVGSLPAPWLGMLAERQRLFRPVFFGGFVALSFGLALLPKVSHLAAWIALAGLGVGATATVAPLFVVDFAPKNEWEPRIGWLQSFNGAGQLLGLLVAGAIAGEPVALGFWLASGLAALAIIVGHIGLPKDGRRRRTFLPPLRWRDLLQGFHSGPAFGGLLRHSHHLQGSALARLPGSFEGGFGRFLLAWGLLYLGVAPFFAYYPLLMENTYGITPATTALAYALAAAIGIGLFVLAGLMAKRSGSRFVFQLGLALRQSGFGVLGALALSPISSPRALALFGFMAIMLAWPVLSVAGTGLAATLTPIGEGAAMGLLSAVNALATGIGTFLGGPLVDAFGYKVVPLVAITAIGIAEILMGPWRRRGDRSAVDEG